MLSCKCCGVMHTPSDVIITEEVPLEEGGGFIQHNYGWDLICSKCRSLAFAEDDYDEMFSETWVKPVKFEKYRE